MGGYSDSEWTFDEIVRTTLNPTIGCNYDSVIIVSKLSFTKEYYSLLLLSPGFEDLNIILFVKIVYL